MPAFRHKNIFEEVKNKSHDEDWVGLPAKVATAAKPGTAEKIEVMVARLEAGEELHSCLPHDWRDRNRNERRNWHRSLSVNNEQSSKLETFVASKVIASQIGVTSKTIMNWVKRGEFPEPCKMMGGRPYWTLTQVIEWQQAPRIDGGK